jgi:hypothetical protein
VIASKEKKNDNKIDAKKENSTKKKFTRSSKLSHKAPRKTFSKTCQENFIAFKSKNEDVNLQILYKTFK